MLENNQDKIDWNVLSGNKNAIHLLDKNQDKIDWKYLSSNLSIFKDEPIPKIIYKNDILYNNAKKYKCTKI